MKTEDLVKNLSSSLKPVKTMPHPLLRFLKWLVVVAMCFGAVIPLIGLRHNIEAALLNPHFVIQAILLVTLAITSAMAAFVLSVPRTDASQWSRWFPIIPATLWAGMIISDLVFAIIAKDSSALLVDFGMACVGDILVLAMVPGVLMFIMIRKAAPTRLGWSGFLALISVAAFGALGSQFMCHKDAPMHLLLWHFLPVAAIAVLGISFGRKLLNW